MDELVHHFETMRNQCLFVFTGESTFLSFLGGAGLRPCTVLLGLLLLLVFVLYLCVFRHDPVCLLFARRRDAAPRWHWQRLQRSLALTVTMVVVGNHFAFFLIVVEWLKSNHLTAKTSFFCSPSNVNQVTRWCFLVWGVGYKEVFRPPIYCPNDTWT